MIPPTESDKGVSKWSLVADDNANSDDRINWAEGMLPSAVNDSARMMMTRIREQHDIDQTTLTNVSQAIVGKFGNKIVYLSADALTITKVADTKFPNGRVVININVDKDDLSSAEYEAFKAQKGFIFLNVIAPDFDKTAGYSDIKHDSVISLTITFVKSNANETFNMEFYMSFWGGGKYNQEIGFEDLHHFINNAFLLRFNGAQVGNLVAVQRKRTYTSVRDVTPVAYKGQRTYWWHESPDLVHVVAVYPAINSGGSSFVTPPVTTFAADDRDGPQVKQGSGGQRRLSMTFPIPGPVQNVISTTMTQGWLYYGSATNETTGDRLVIEAMDFRSKYDGLLYSDGPGNIHVTTLNNGKHASEFPIHFSPTGIVENLI